MNARIPLPVAPHRDCSQTECRTCGEVRSRRKPTYKPTTWAEAVELFRAQNRDNPDTFWSRGGILWARRVLALQRWYERHSLCA